MKREQTRKQIKPTLFFFFKQQNIFIVKNPIPITRCNQSKATSKSLLDLTSFGSTDQFTGSCIRRNSNGYILAENLKRRWLPELPQTSPKLSVHRRLNIELNRTFRPITIEIGNSTWFKVSIVGGECCCTESEFTSLALFKLIKCYFSDEFGMIGEGSAKFVISNSRLLVTVMEGKTEAPCAGNALVGSVEV